MDTRELMQLPPELVILVLAHATLSAFGRLKRCCHAVRNLGTGEVLQRKMQEAASQIYLLGGGGEDYDWTRSDGYVRADRMTSVVKLQADGQWVDMPQMPTARSCAGAAVLGSDIYVVGGSPGVRGVDCDIPSSAVEKFDTMRNEWQAMPAMQVERTALAAAVIGNSIYVAGGMNHRDGRDHRLKSAERYDDGAWTQLPDMPTCREGASAAVIAGKLLVIGGAANDDQEPLRSVDVFDPQTSSWSPGPQMNYGREHAAVAVLDGICYVMGGTGAQDSRMNSAERLEGGTWTMLPPMPTARAGAAAAVTQRVHGAHGFRLEISVFGGNGQGANPNWDYDPINTVEAFDPQTQEWTTMPGMAICRGDAAVARL